MAKTIQKAFRLPEDVVAILGVKESATQYLVEAIREKSERERKEEIRRGLENLGFAGGDNDVSWMKESQARVVARED